MAEAKRAIRAVDALDTAGDHLAEMLRRTDALLAEWSQFGAAVRAQVEREATQIGSAVGDAVESAVRRATSAGVDRAFADQLGAKLAALSAEIAKVETRARAASRAITDQHRGDRGLLYGLGAVILIANGLVIALLLRSSPLPAPAPVVEPAPVVAPPIVPAPEVAPPAPEKKAEAEPAPEKPVVSEADRPDTKQPAGKPSIERDVVKSPPAHKAVKLGPPTPRGAKPLAIPQAKKP
jgi:hypothetical protein